MAELLAGLPVFSVVVTLAAMLGGLYAFRKAQTRQLGDLQAAVITTLHTQNEVQAQENTSLKSDLRACRQELAGIALALKQIGMSIEVSGDVVTLIDESLPRQRRRTQIRLVKPGEEKD